MIKFETNKFLFIIPTRNLFQKSLNHPQFQPEFEKIPQIKTFFSNHSSWKTMIQKKKNLLYRPFHRV